MAQVWSLTQEFTHAVGVVKNLKKKNLGSISLVSSAHILNVPSDNFFHIYIYIYIYIYIICVTTSNQCLWHYSHFKIFLMSFHDQHPASCGHGDLGSYHQRLDLPVLELHIKRIVWCVLFVSGIFPTGLHFWDSSLLLSSAVCSFELLCSIPLLENTIIYLSILCWRQILLCPFYGWETWASGRASLFHLK